MSTRDAALLVLTAFPVACGSDSAPAVRAYSRNDVIAALNAVEAYDWDTFLRTRVEQESLRNVQIVEGTADDPMLPENTLDAALIVNAYHEMSEHQAMLAHLRKALKPTGRLIIVEPISPSRRDGNRESQASRHEIAPEFVLRDAREAGFSVAALEDPFSNHHGHGSEYMLAL